MYQEHFLWLSQVGLFIGLINQWNIKYDYKISTPGFKKEYEEQYIYDIYIYTLTASIHIFCIFMPYCIYVEQNKH